MIETNRPKAVAT